MWQRRAALYLKVMEHLHGGVSFPDGPSWEEYQQAGSLQERQELLLNVHLYGPSTPDQLRLRGRLEDELAVFGSARVQELWRAATSALRDLDFEVTEGGHGERVGNEEYPTPPEPGSRHEEFAVAAKAARDALVYQIRRELHKGRDSSRRWERVREAFRAGRSPSSNPW
ncbi:hypothetical protein DUI70_6928 [Streptomyces albus]|nr:hypothetical protein DUI70_6928 [Streptomyces albus]